MSDKDKGSGSELDVWGVMLKIGLPVGGIAILYLLARKGEVMAIVTLAVIGTVVLIGLGILLTLAILDRLHKAEQLRFSQNVQENMALLNQMQRVQGNQARSLLDSNARLLKMLPTPDQKPTDIDALLWDVYEDGEAFQQ